MSKPPEPWERWQFANFDTAGGPGNAGASANPQNATAAHEIDPATLARIEQLHESARQQGYAAGQEAGYAAGHAAGQEQTRLEAQRLNQLISQFNQALHDIDRQIAEDMLALSLEVARQIIRQNLRAQPGLILDTLRQALTQLRHPEATITLHPEDAMLARAYLAETAAHTGTKILEDANVTRGGCLVEAAGSQIDATLETRWRRTLESLGQSSEWLTPAPAPDPDPENTAASALSPEEDTNTPAGYGTDAPLSGS